MTEEWKEIDGFDGAYLVSTAGRIISLVRGNRRELKGSLNGDGYREITLTKQGKPVRRYVHRLVAETFIPNPWGKPCVNHRDYDRSNNAVSNLEWVTYYENSEYSYERVVAASREKSCKPVIQYDKRGNFIHRYESLSEAGRETGVNVGHIGRCVKGYEKTAGGYIWRYA